MPRVPDTLTTMEAGFTLREEHAAEFWKHQERMGPIAAKSPGFMSVIGGEIKYSPWMYFCGKWESPEMMDAWYKNPAHYPVQKAAHDRWFGACYIRKWRQPEAGEAIDGPVFCETFIACNLPLPQDQVDLLYSEISNEIVKFKPSPFETMRGHFEAKPFQLVGPLQEFPEVATARYLILTHWESDAKAKAWLESDGFTNLAEYGEVSSTINVLIRHKDGEREGLNPDGSQREFGVLSMKL